MKALEKDRRRRYETANDFAADVMRYLTDQPVEACPPSAWYRFGEVRPAQPGGPDDRGLWSASPWSRARRSAPGRRSGPRGPARWRAADGRRRPGTPAAESRPSSSSWLTTCWGVSPEKALGRDLKVSRFSPTPRRRSTRRFPNQPLVEAGVRHALAVAYLAPGSIRRSPGATPRGARTSASALLGPEHPDTLKSMHGLADCASHARASMTKPASSTSRCWRSRRRPRPGASRHADSMNNLAIVLQSRVSLTRPAS